MINYEGTETPIICPFCKSASDCQHLFAVYDVTFNSIEGGYIFDKEEFSNILIGFFNTYIKEHGFTKDLINVKNPSLKDIWNEIYHNKKEYLLNKETGEWHIDLSSNFNQYYFEQIEEIISPEYGEFEGGPGTSSSYKIYYSKDVISDYKKLIELVKKNLRET